MQISFDAAHAFEHSYAPLQIRETTEVVKLNLLYIP